MEKFTVHAIEEKRKEFLTDLNRTADREELFIKYLGRKGIIKELTGSLPSLSPALRAKAGKALNELKVFIKQQLDREKLEARSSKLEARSLDLTMPGLRARRGHYHPLTLVQSELVRIFTNLNFSVVEGPEVETEHYNFDALNIPKNHPARDMWDTFWLKTTNNQKRTTNNSRQWSGVGGRLLLRTHTSPMQVRFMEKHQPPLRIVVPGKTFRYEASDATHGSEFYQLEGLFVDKKVSIAQFKGVMELFLKQLFRKEFGGIRLRPSYFPFVEPAFEVDFYWKRKEQWLELMGAGMVHPKVFEAAGFAPGQWQGFAFGLGIDRVAMMKYNIPDIRLLYSGDLRVIRQF